MKPDPEDERFKMLPILEIRKAFEHFSHLNHAILDEAGEVVPIEVYDNKHQLIQSMLIQWAEWFETHDAQRRIGRDELDHHLVSTVFLGLNHQYVPGGRPLWFETIVFGPQESEPFPGSTDYYPRPSLWSARCTTRAEALAQHQEGLTFLKSIHGVNEYPGSK
jgi:hypothetical protein